MLNSFKTTALSAHPENAKIYGDTFDAELLSKIEKVGILTPILIAKDNRIISGHRRWECAKALNLETVPALVFESEDENDILEAMIMANEQRERTTEQKTREYQTLKGVEAERNKLRQLSGLKNQNIVVENLPQRDPGKSRDIAAQKVGMSGKSAEKAAQVVEVIDAMEATGETEKAEEIRTKLNKTINGAHNAVKPVLEEKKKVVEEVKGARQNIEHLSEKLAIVHSKNPNYKPTFNATNENINWAGWSWNPVTGCLHDCPYCYARATATNSYYRDAFPTQFKPTFHPGRLTAPENTRIPQGKQGIDGMRRVFVGSMADIFGDWVPVEWIQKIIAVCEKNTQWDYLFLTKNPKRYLEFEFPKNCWLGATADTQARADEAVIAFAEFDEKTKAKDGYSNIKFLSCEPLIEPIFLKETDPCVVDLLIIGALKNSEKDMKKQPKWKWVESLILQAVRADCLYVFKPNLVVRPSEYPTRN